MGSLKGNFADGSKVHYNDKPSRMAIIKFANEAKGIELINNPNTKGIDLLIKGDIYGAGWEVEQAQHYGDYRKNGNCHFLLDASPSHSQATVNMSDRKFCYWINGTHLNDWGNFRYIETNAERNWFTRIDLTLKQIILLSPEVILNEQIRLVAWKRAKSIYKDRMEQWWGYPLEYAEIWNEVNGIWTLEK